MGYKILLVEDNELVHKILSLACKSHILVSAFSAEEAYLKMQSADFDLIALDVDLPGENGFQFCERLKKNPKFRHIPIVFLTAKAQAEDKIRGHLLGASDYLVKPLQPAEFQAYIEKYALKKHATN